MASSRPEEAIATTDADDHTIEPSVIEIGSLAVIGAGKMGEVLISALVASGVIKPESIVATAHHQGRLETLSERFGVRATLDNRAAVRGADFVLLCVKPQVAPAVLDEIRHDMEPDQVLVSIVAGLSTTQIESMLTAAETSEPTPEIPVVVRAMPNTPARLGYGMTAVCGGRLAELHHLRTANAIFSAIGRSMILDEKYFDAVTGLSASGPAFLYIVIEALAEGGVKVGLPRKVATELAAQTCLGAGHMVLETGDHPALLKDEVTTPAGCTMDGILALETGGLRVTLITAVMRAVERAGGLVGSGDD